MEKEEFKEECGVDGGGDGGDGGSASVSRVRDSGRRKRL